MPPHLMDAEVGKRPTPGRQARHGQGAIIAGGACGRSTALINPTRIAFPEGAWGRSRNGRGHYDALYVALAARSAARSSLPTPASARSPGLPCDVQLVD